MAHARSSGGDQVLRVKQANDLVGVMQEYVTLQRAGRKYKVCCPFHESKRGGRERTPSLHVDPDKQMWYCYGAGCGRGGSVIDFVMEYEGLDFLGALKRLAERAGIELEPLKRKRRNPGEVERDGIHKLLQEAQAIYREAYRGSPAEAYVHSRGISEEVARRYGLGYAPDGWETTKQRLRQRWDERALLQAGLVREKGPTSRTASLPATYDFFRNRLTIPIRDVQGTVLGFGARALSAEAKAKYINSPQTEVYDKSTVLFGVDLAREAIRTTRRAIVMEGYTDVMLAHQYGVENCVAPCGTALTAQQLPLLRQADKLTLLFDGDIPGIGAAERALQVLFAKGVHAEIVILPDDLDPADFLVEHGGEAFRAFLEEAPRSPVAFKLEVLRSRFDFADPVAKAQAVQECLALVAVCESAVVREGLLQHFAEGLELPVAALREEYAQRHAPRQERRVDERRVDEDGQAASPRRGARSGGRSPSSPRRWSTPVGGSNRRSRPWERESVGIPVEAPALQLKPHSREEIALMCAVAEPELAGAFERTFGVTSLPDGPLRDIADWLLRLASRPGGLNKATFASDLMSMLEPEARKLLLNRLVSHLGGEQMLEGKPKEPDEEESLIKDAPDVREVFAACVEAAQAQRARVEAVEARRQFAAQPEAELGDDEASRAALQRHLEVQRMRASRKRPRPPSTS